MRVVLEKGQQRRLIENAKCRLSLPWGEFAKSLGVNYSTLNYWRYERCLIPSRILSSLDPKKEFQKYIIRRYPENWGQIKGGKLSGGGERNKRRILKPPNNELLAEFVGIVLGDGNIYVRKDYDINEISICGDKRNEKEYLQGFVAELCFNLFGLRPAIKLHKTHNELFLKIRSVELVKFLEEKGLKEGDKIKNKSSIPKWITKDKALLKACLRGLIDTDGGIYELKPHWPGLIQLSFKNNNETLLRGVREGLLELGFPISKIYKNKIYLTRQKEVDRYFKEVGFSNKKHALKYLKIRNQNTALSSSGQIQKEA